MSNTHDNIQPQTLLHSLRWHEDMAVINDFGEHVWLKPYYNSDGKRIGITECCFVDSPCEWHKKIAESQIIRKPGNA